MQEYKEMYYRLFNRITDLIEELKELQRETEEMYISAEEKIIKFPEDNRK